MPNPIDMQPPVFGYYVVHEDIGYIVTCGHRPYRTVYPTQEAADAAAAQANLDDYKAIRKAEYEYAGISLEELTTSLWEGRVEYLNELRETRLAIKGRWPKPADAPQSVSTLVSYDVKSSLNYQTLISGQVKDTLFANVGSFSSGVIGLYSVIGDALDWGNYKAVKDTLDGALQTHMITQEEYDGFFALLTSFNLDWTSTGVANPNPDPPYSGYSGV